MSSSSPNHALDGESRFGQIAAILAVGSAISTAAVVLRAWCRASLLRSFGLDDAVMVFAQMLTIGTAVCIGLEAKYGLGKHAWTMPLENFIPYMKSFYSSVVIYNVGGCIVKFSILVQYRRIFAVPFMQRLTAVGLVLISCWTVTLALLLPLVCWPVAKFWIPTMEGRCLNELAIWYVMAGVNIFTDTAICIMPLPVVKSLKLPRRQKAMLMAVFALGGTTVIISIYRVQTLRVASTTEDPTWDNVDAAIWSFIELVIGVLAACLPTLRPVLARLLPRVFGGASSGTNSQGTRGAGHRGTGVGGAGGLWPRSSAGKPTLLGSGSANRDSDSTENLNGKETLDYALASLPSHHQDVLGAAYSVSVAAQKGARGYGEGRGIQTTTVVSQRIEKTDAYH